MHIICVYVCVYIYIYIYIFIYLVIFISFTTFAAKKCLLERVASPGVRPSGSPRQSGRDP